MWFHSNLAVNQARQGLFFLGKNWDLGLGQSRLCCKELSPGHLAMQIAQCEQGLQPTLRSPRPSSEPQSIQQHQETRLNSRRLGVHEDRGKDKSKWWGPGPDCLGAIRRAGSGPRHYQVHLQAFSCPEEIGVFSGRCSEKRSCVGAVLATDRPTSPWSQLKGWTITQSVDKEIQSGAFLQGKRCAGPGPGLPTPVSEWIPKCTVTGLAPLKLGSQRFFKRQDEKTPSC